MKYWKNNKKPNGLRNADSTQKVGYLIWREAEASEGGSGIPE